jgi:hypothetical protein
MRHAHRSQVRLSQQHGKQRALGVQPVLRLIENDRLRRLDRLVEDLLATMRRQVVHDHGVRRRLSNQPQIDLKPGEVTLPATEPPLACAATAAASSTVPGGS